MVFGIGVGCFGVWRQVEWGWRRGLDECIVCDNVAIPAGAQYERCAIVPDDGRQLRDGERRESGLLLKAF